jgi:hypothetical protein
MSLPVEGQVKSKGGQSEPHEHDMPPATGGWYVGQGMCTSLAAAAAAGRQGGPSVVQGAVLM